MNQDINTITLYRPVGPGQMQAIIESGWRRFPARLASQKFFYPLLHESFARRIARQWHVERSGVGYVTAFQLPQAFLEPLPVYMVGGPEHKEYRILASDLRQFNDHIVGKIRVVGRYGVPLTERQSPNLNTVNDGLLAV